MNACLAQLVEHLPRKQKAKGSTPLTGFFTFTNTAILTEKSNKIILIPLIKFLKQIYYLTIMLTYYIQQ